MIVAMPLALVFDVAAESDPPPVPTFHATACPLTGAPSASVTSTARATGSAIDG